MKFILIAWLLSGPSNFAPVTTAVFDDKPACENALKEISLSWGYVASGTPGRDGGVQMVSPGVCVPQASDEPADAPKLASAPSKATAPVARK